MGRRKAYHYDKSGINHIKINRWNNYTLAFTSAFPLVISSKTMSALLTSQV